MRLCIIGLEYVDDTTLFELDFNLIYEDYYILNAYQLLFSDGTILPPRRDYSCDYL